MKYIHNSIKGSKRAVNEDGVLLVNHEKYYLFALCDGVGSASDAKPAVLMASQAIKNQHNEYYRNGEFRLGNLMHDINQVLVNSALSNPYTTYVALFVPKHPYSPWLYSSMGDSRLYGISKKYIHQYTKDDSVYKNKITNCLGKKLVQLASLTRLN